MSKFILPEAYIEQVKEIESNIEKQEDLINRLSMVGADTIDLKLKLEDAKAKLARFKKAFEVS